MNLNNLSASEVLELELEQESIDMGIAAYRKALAEGGHAAVSAGTALMKAATQPLLGALNGWLLACRTGVPSKSASVFYFIDQFDPEVVAWVTARTVVSMLHERPSLARTASAVALNLEAQANFAEVEKAEPSLARKMARKLEQRFGEAATSRALYVRRGGRLADVKVVHWDDSVRVRIGTLLVSMLEDTTGLVTMELERRGTKTATIVRPTEACLRWLESSHARCELLTPMRLPMVCRPRDWTNPFNGGYLMHALRRPLVKTRNRGYLQTLRDHDMPWVYAGVNALQATAWAVNVPVMDVVRTLWDSGLDLDVLPPQVQDIPARPWAEGEEPTPEALHAWKVAAARTYEHNARAESKRAQLTQKLWVAEMMIARGNRFHYVYNLDWRGRMYPVGPALTPQGDDAAKAMLRFAKSSPLGDDGAYWLAIHGANTYGVDKVSFDERIQWVQDNELDILRYGQDPLAHTGWMGADSPFCFLAFCMEWTRLQRWVDAGGRQEDFESALPVAFDGSCNGLQNFSAMLRDPVGGKATGLVPSEKPADIYSEVARAAQALIDGKAAQGDAVAQRWVGKMTRKLAKRNTMTVPYGVTRRGMRDQLFAELGDSAPEHRAEDAEFLAATNYEAIGNVVVAARQAMDWLRAAAKVAASEALPVRWTAPSGLLVVQDYREDVGTELDFTLLGRRFRVILQKDGDKLAVRKQALGISPNFVHSLDAAHLVRTVLFCAQDGIEEFAMIHDSYGVPAGHASRLRDNLREAFVEQYSQPVLEQFRNELLEQLSPEKQAELPPLPAMGDLDLQAVRQSDYFFA